MVHKKGRIDGQCVKTCQSVAQIHCTITLLSSKYNVSSWKVCLQMLVYSSVTVMINTYIDVSIQ